MFENVSKYLISAQVWHKFHKAYAEAFLQGFARAWGREVTAEERAIIRSSVCCLGGMRTELIDQALTTFPTPERADDEFRYIATEVESCRAELIELCKNDSSNPVKPEAFPDLLSWETALLGKDAEN